MLQKFWQPLQAAVFHDKGYTFFVILAQNVPYFYKTFRIGTELSFIGTVLRLNRISTHVIMVLLKVISFHSTFLQGAVFYFSRRNKLSMAGFYTSVFVTRKLIIDDSNT